VLVCASCGRESEGEFAFCPYCGAALEAAAPSGEQRKTVTVLFCDLTGSTPLGESTDPEAVRALLARYFERMKWIVESHGGTVEKFIGDAVMAVFGVPQVHEDDPLRACRAAIEMREALPELGVQARIGLNTGEVVTGTEERLATGDAVNVAARLEQAAESGEILLGSETLALVRAAVETEPVEALELKGKAELVPAHRLVTVHEAPERRHDMPFVGRSGELESLQKAWQRAVEERRCELVTVAGDAGVGKSRLAAEFLASVEAPIVGGRCLSYGEGITYWPVVEVVKQLDALPSDPAAAASLRSLLGETDEGTSAEEIAWAFRKLLEERSPLVCVFDDIQWGEATFLDLVEGIALLSSHAPILLLCMARPDLSERRLAWPMALRLEPLDEDAVDALLPETIPAEEREQIARAAGGNPLFITEMVVMALETEGEVTVPPSLQALLASRLDQLESAERSVLERGAVEGEVFHRGSIQALAPEERDVTPRLAALVRKELIRPDKPRLLAEDAFRFRHLLIRDAAYESLPKATRAELHERFADWLEDRGRGLVELDELVGYHLEQAARYKAELGQSDPKVAARAGERLANAGRRALWRGDFRAAKPLLERALELTRPLRFDVHLEVDLADVVRGTDPREAADLAGAAAARAGAAGDEAGEALARVLAAYCRIGFDPDFPVDELEALARAAIPLLERAEDHEGLAHVWFALGTGVANIRGRHGERAYASEQALHHARLAGRRRNDLYYLAPALALGPRPADEALQALDAALSDVPPPGPQLVRAYLLAMLGRFDEAWAIAREQTERLREMGGIGHAWVPWMARLEGDEASAARDFRTICDSLETHGQSAFLSTYAPELGRSLCALGRYDEAEPLAQLGRELGNEQDATTQSLWRQVQARVHAHRGEYADAERLAHEAVHIAEQSDALNFQGDALCDLAEVLATAGRTDEATDALEQALERYERKRNLAMVAQVRPRLDELRSGVT
jgi:class 3 adenylate cyclase/predicted negative regulator of RcsB-dependent stress response